jgi:FlaA1/EpsC-like NDP-sugar epimerase
VVTEIFHRRRAAEVMLDFCLVFLAYWAAYRLRFNDRDFTANFSAFINTLPIVVASQMVMLFVVGAYRGLWKHFGLHDAVTFGKAALIGPLVAQVVILAFYRTIFYSRGAFVLYVILLFVALSVSRASFRLISEFVNRRRQTGVRLAIYGAGSGGALAVRELLDHPTVTYRFLGFFDDDPLKKRMRLHGYQVLGGQDHLFRLIERHEVDSIVISAKRFDLFRQRQLEALCSRHGVVLSRLRVDLEPLVGVADDAVS